MYNEMFIKSFTQSFQKKSNVEIQSAIKATWNLRIGEPITIAGMNILRERIGQEADIWYNGLIESGYSNVCKR